MECTKLTKVAHPASDKTGPLVSRRTEEEGMLLMITIGPEQCLVGCALVDPLSEGAVYCGNSYTVGV